VTGDEPNIMKKNVYIITSVVIIIGIIFLVLDKDKFTISDIVIIKEFLMYHFQFIMKQKVNYQTNWLSVHIKINILVRQL